MRDVRWVTNATDEAIADHVSGTIAPDRPVAWALPGGRTPAPIFAALINRGLSLNLVSIVPTDDRTVEADHPASNFGLLKRTFASAGAQVRPLTPDMTVSTFDLVWLGMGEDGHVASIFPNNLAEVPARPTVVRTRPEPLPPDAPYERLTLTFAALTACRDLIFVISGEEKKKVMEKAIGGEPGLPASHLIAQRRSAVTIYWKK
jgi:6-phosphogluconolactonase